MRKPDENTGIIFKAAKKPGTKQPDFKGQLYVTKPGVYKIVAWKGYTKTDKTEYVSFRLELLPEESDSKE